MGRSPCWRSLSSMASTMASTCGVLKPVQTRKASVKAPRPVKSRSVTAAACLSCAASMAQRSSGRRGSAVTIQGLLNNVVLDGARNKPANAAAAVEAAADGGGGDAAGDAIKEMHRRAEQRDLAAAGAEIAGRFGQQALRDHLPQGVAGDAGPVGHDEIAQAEQGLVF